MINWDDKFAADTHLYGIEANDYLAEKMEHLPKGSALSLGEGEGRNAVYLAENGFTVAAIDNSLRGLEKASKLAKERKVELETIHADLKEVDLGSEKYDLIISIFCHMPSAVRQIAHQKAVKALKVGGYLLLEAYTPKQIELGTGGPKNEDLLLTIAKAKSEFVDFEFIELDEIYREIHEGTGHNGKSHVLRMLAQKKARVS